MTALIERITSTPITYEIKREEIAEKVEQYGALTIASIEDQAGYKAVRDARLDLKKVRVSIENRRKELKADALKYGQQVDAVARELTALIEPTERRLESEEKRIDAEKVRIKEEAEKAKQRKLQDRVNAIAPTGAQIPLGTLQSMSDDEFAVYLAECQEEHRIASEKRAAEEAERKRIEAEEAERRKAEESRQAAEMEERRRIEQQRLEEERQRLAAERAELDRQREAQEAEAQEAEARRIAEERARIEAEQRAKAEAEAAERRAKEKAEKEAAEQARREALRPDREKLLTVVSAIRSITVPEVSAEVESVAQIVRQGLHRSAQIIEDAINHSLPE